MTTMCLAIPGEVIELDPPTALVDFGGIRKVVDVSLVETEIGDYVYVHAGFAIQVLDRRRAEETLDLWREMLARVPRAPTEEGGVR